MEDRLPPVACETIESTRDTTAYILEEAGVALVPFYAVFGSTEDSVWYRLSVGTSKLSDIETVGKNLKKALQALTPVAVHQ